MKKQANTNPATQQKQGFFDKQEEHIYKILTGKIRYKPEPFQDSDLKPDLIIKMKVPKQPYIARGSYLSLSSFITSPDQKLERVYSKAEKEIMKEMETNKENVDPHNIRMRMQLSLNTIEPVVKKSKLINEHQQQEILEFQCINSLNGILDAFTIQYNCMIYTLQHVCGFRVKSFILYDKHVEEREIYLFLTISTENLLRVANKYRIKKEVDYTFFDFYLNDPTTKDQRPIKLNSKFKSDTYSTRQYKHLSRYFHVKEGQSKDQQIVKQADLNDDQLQNFRSCNQELHLLYEYIKYKQHNKLTNSQKMYIFQHNRRKINPGVEKLYALIKKRREYFNISKEILPKYGYHVWDEPTVFEEFSLPDKNSKGATFFNKFQSIMLYKPLLTNKDGGLSLFLNMERTKLSYMLVKQNFKVSYLNKIGMDIFTIDNQFQKFGNEIKINDIQGGIDNKNLVDNWNYYSLFSDMKVIRNYMGERIAYEILYNNYIFGYMLSIIIPYIILFAMEIAFADEVYVATSFAQALMFSVSYSIFMVEWQNKEGQFIKNYCDSVESKIFLSKFRGPYKRNVITDEPNEFSSPQGFATYMKNLVCFILIVVLLVILGAIFHGFRMMIVEIYEPLSNYVFHDQISLPHIIGYLLFFIVQEAFRFLLADKIISFMVYLQNPPSDEDQRQWQDTLTFFYLLAIEMIPPFFILILEPFSRTSCYAFNCQSQLVFYIFSRYIIMLALVICKLGYVMIIQYIRKNLKQLMKKEKEPEVFFQDKLGGLLKRAMADAAKDDHKEQKMGNIINLQNYAIYCTMLPISPVIMCLAVFIHFTKMRLSLIYDQRRPLNRSESVIPFSKQFRYVFYLGVMLNSWINVFLFQLAELNLQSIIQALATNVNEQAVFLVKFIATCIYAAILVIAGMIVSSVVKAYSTDSVNARKDNKYRQYKTSRGGLKIILKKYDEMVPLKSIFRIFNPQTSSSELLNQAIYENIIDLQDQVAAAALLDGTENENMGSATHLQKQ